MDIIDTQSQLSGMLQKRTWFPSSLEGRVVVLDAVYPLTHDANHPASLEPQCLFTRWEARDTQHVRK